MVQLPMSAQVKGPILVTGGSGQLAVSLEKLGGARVIRVGRPEFDFDRPETIAAAVQTYKPAVVVNAAAWTAVDLAETEHEAAARANDSGPAELARVCRAAGIPLVHVSTDYVFDGSKGAPYVETDPVSPQTVYGSTKAAGERAVLAAHPMSVVLRTSWVYSSHGKNFVRTMINAGAKTSHLRVVGDQTGNPTSSDDLAEAILAIIAKVETEGWQEGWAGLYHASGTGETSWHGLAVYTFEEAAKQGRAMPEVTAIRTEDWPTPAKRPADSRLDCGKLERVFGVKLPEWRESVARTVRQILGAA